MTLKSFIRQNRFIDITSEHCFDFTLADFEQRINNDFMQLKANFINAISLIYFPGSQTNLE